MSPKPIVWSFKTAKEVTGLSATSLHKLLSNGTITRRKVGNRTYVCPNEVRALFGLPEEGNDGR